MAANTPLRDLFLWKKEHDKYFIREVLLIEPYMQKEQSKERGLAWKAISDNLNNMEYPEFRVSPRSVRDHFKKLMDKFKKLENDELRASGIQGVEYDEISRGLVDIKERMEEAKLIWSEESEKRRDKDKKDKQKAEDMRKKATESLGETRRREETEGQPQEAPNRKRKSTEALALMREGLKWRREQEERETRIREEELEERRLARESQQMAMKEQQEFLMNMQLQQQQYMAQMQQQNIQILQTITSLVNSINKKDN